MARRFNYTQRKKLSGQNITTRMVSTDPPVASVALHLSEEQLDPGARVFLEAYVGNISKRIDCNTVGDLKVPQTIDLRELQVGGSIHFRVKVVSSGGLLLASADRIRLAGASEDSDRKPLMTVETTPELGEEIWRVEVSQSEHPRLLLNSRVHSIEDRLLRDPVLGGAILIPAVERVLHLLADDLEGDVWQPDWVIFAKMFRPDTDPQKIMRPEEREEWVQDVISGFSKEHGFAGRAHELVDG
ncbi:hypothetical protein [Ruegeria arenilitoris]|uniref:hypothetical protein n=1 Tax=Ruegeria arenilitoris TaxID=1173585 RepID=UPI00147D64EF|nr:hypothetical protein [Ruegeria arenilitoris]